MFLPKLPPRNLKSILKSGIKSGQNVKFSVVTVLHFPRQQRMDIETEFGPGLDMGQLMHYYEEFSLEEFEKDKPAVRTRIKPLTNLQRYCLLVECGVDVKFRFDPMAQSGEPRYNLCYNDYNYRPSVLV